MTRLAEPNLALVFEPTPIQFKPIIGSSMSFQLTDLDANLDVALVAPLDACLYTTCLDVIMETDLDADLDALLVVPLDTDRTCT